MIETERLHLRNWRDGDAALLHQHCNRPAVMRWLGGIASKEDQEAAVGRLELLQEERGHTLWVVERKADGAFLGFCGLKIANAPNSKVAGELEIGWRLREDGWGQGYATEAARASLDFAFERLGVDRVVALTVAGNEPSWRLMVRLGMRRREHLDYVDPRFGEELNPTIVYEIQRKEWKR